MKNKIINYFIKKIKQEQHYSDEQIAEIKYGLEAIYLTISKTILIFIMAAFTGVFKEIYTFDMPLLENVYVKYLELLLEVLPTECMLVRL